MFSSIFNLASTILGSSSLAMAYAVSNAGIGLFAVLLAIVGVAAERAVYYMAKATHMTGHFDYMRVGEEALGTFGRQLVIWSIVIQQIGAAAAFINIVGDVIKGLIDVIPHGGDRGILSEARFWQIMIALCIMLPLCLFRTITALRFASLIAVSLVIGFALVVCVDGFSRLSEGAVEHGSVHAGPSDPIGTFVSLPILLFAFVCHFNVHPLMQELQQPSEARMAWVARGAVGITMGIYLITGIAGYLAFAQYTQADLISSYECVERDQLPGDGYGHGHITVPKGLVLFVQTGIGAALTLSFPVIAFELRHCLELLAFGEGHVSFGAHAGVVVVMVLACGSLGVFVPNLGQVFGFAGATTSNLIVFVMPALFFLNIHWKKQKGQLSSGVQPLVTLGDGTVLIPGEDDARIDAHSRGGLKLDGPASKGAGEEGEGESGEGREPSFEEVQHSTPNGSGGGAGRGMNGTGNGRAAAGVGLVEEAALLDGGPGGAGVSTGGVSSAINST